MTSSFESPVSAVDLTRFGRAFWLPPFGEGNGLDALFGPAWQNSRAGRSAAPWRPSATRTSPAGRRRPKKPKVLPRVKDGDEPYQLWVATVRYNGAEDVLIRVLNEER